MKTGIIAIIASTILVTSCVEKNAFKDIHVYPDTSLPIGSLSVSDSTIFALAQIREGMTVGEDGVITFHFSENAGLSEPGASTPIFTFNAQHLAIHESLSHLPPGIHFIDITTPIELEFPLLGLGDGVTVNKMSFVNGYLDLQINGLNVPGYNPNELSITIPEIDVNGSPLVIHPGDRISLTPETPMHLDSDNIMKVYISGRIPVMTTLTGSLVLDPQGEVYSAEGYFGRTEISNVSLSLLAPTGFEDFVSQINYVHFENPAVELHVFNQYDVPIMARMDKLIFDGVTEVNIKPGLNTQTLYIPPMGEGKIVINNQSTIGGNELSDAITKDFKKVHVLISSVSNPTAEDLGDPAYVAPTFNSMKIDDRITGKVVTDVPLDCVIDKLGFIDYVKVDLRQLVKDDLSYQRLDFTLTGYNQLPLDMAITPYITSADGVLTKLFDEPLIFPASINNMLPTQSGFQPSVIGRDNIISRTIPSAMIDQLLKSSRLTLDFTTSTKGAGQRTPVKIFSPAELNLQLTIGARADITVGTGN